MSPPDPQTPARASAEAGPPRLALALVAAIVLLLTGATAASLGVWEPWEAETANLVERMSGGQWLTVDAGDGDREKTLAALPYRWWPVAASVSVFGTSGFALRLPGLLLAVLAALMLFSLLHRTHGRVAAWASVLALLAMPLFGYHARHAFGAGIPASLLTLGACGLLGAASGRVPGWWRWAGWGATAAAGLTAGTVGLLVPVLALAAALHGDSRPWTRLRAVTVNGIAPGAAVAIVAVGWWAATGGDPDRATMLLWAETTEGRPGTITPFHMFVHQIGFGLFPLAALLPFAFGSLLWPGDDDEADGAPAMAAMDQGLAAWFAAACLGAALMTQAAGVQPFLGAAAAAAVVGVFLQRLAASERPQPALFLGVVMVLALLDSNLKHDTHFFADTLLTADVEGFPAKLGIWRLSRLLSVALLVGLLALQTRAFVRLPDIVRGALCPKQRLTPSGWWVVFAVCTIAALALVNGQRPEWSQAILRHKGWGPLVTGARTAILVVALAVPPAIAIRFLWNARVAQVHGRGGVVGGYVESMLEVLLRLGDAVGERLSSPARALSLVMVVLMCWGAFFNLGVASALTAHFSQEGLVDRYRSLADDDEALFRYRVGAGRASFYTDRLTEMTTADFRARAPGGDRFFAIVPRDRLAAVNDEFRRATDRTLPVLDARSNRFLLVSNALEAGETDENPIKQALVDAVPEGVSKVMSPPANFDDKVELVAWNIEPKRPKPGAPMALTMYWKVKKKVSGNYKVFVHIDAPGTRIHGDHDPVEGLYPTSRWTPGDIVRDVHRITVKGSAKPARYTFYAGLYKGSKRMPVKSKAKDKENRANLGYVRVR